MYKNAFKFFIDALPEFLQANSLAKKLTQHLATIEPNFILNNNWDTAL